MSAIRAIETEYAGYRFRSRLEARWAVFFTLAGYRWEYEPEGFELPGGMRYLPDFRVRCGPPGMERVVWYEVKPSGTKTDEKFTAFRQALNGGRHEVDELTDFAGYQDALLLAGDPLEYLQTREVCPRCGVLQLDCMGVEDCFSGHADEWVCSCHWCDWTTPCGGDHPEEEGWLCPVKPHKGLLQMRARDYQSGMDGIFRAAVAARAERFNARRAA
jgi:hypothetical protein